MSSPPTYSTLGQQQWPTQPNQDVMGPVKAAAVAFGLEWLSTLIPIALFIIITYCCVKRKRHQASQTEVATEMTASRPEPDGQDQPQDGIAETVIQVEPHQKDFVLVVDDPN